MKDAARKKTREAHEKKLAQMKSTLEGKVAEVEQELTTAEEALKRADELGKPLVGTRIKALKTTEIMPMVEEIEAKLEKAKDTLDEVRKDTSTMAEDVHPQLQDWITGESKKLAARATGMLPRLEVQKALLKRANAELKKQDAIEVRALELQVVDALKNHQKANKLTADEMFDALSKKKQTVDKASFLAFFKNVEVSESFAAADLERVFKCLAEGQTTVSKENITSALRVYMKVTRDTVMTGGLSIKTSKPKRRLEVGEIVELLGHPTSEGALESIMRAECRAMSDSMQGWVTLSGNAGSSFLEAITPVYKVVKQTIMTDTFEEVSEETSKEDARKLNIGEEVEVLTWPMKEEQSGFQRLKCRTKPDSLVGWVTVVGDAGTKFLETV